MIIVSAIAQLLMCGALCAGMSYFWIRGSMLIARDALKQARARRSSHLKT